MRLIADNSDNLFSRRVFNFIIGNYAPRWTGNFLTVRYPRRLLQRLRLFVRLPVRLRRRVRRRQVPAGGQIRRRQVQAGRVRRRQILPGQVRTGGGDLAGRRILLQPVLQSLLRGLLPAVLPPQRPLPSGVAIRVPTVRLLTPDGRSSTNERFKFGSTRNRFSFLFTVLTLHVVTVPVVRAKTKTINVPV